jgi:mono/diheme cytochrome c family protein
MKRFLKILGVLLILVVITALAAGPTCATQTGLRTAPKLAVATTPDRVQRGAYLANHVAVCMDCHSKRDWSRFSGPVLAGTEGAGGEPFTKDMGFPGDFYSKNITPGGLKEWTDGEIFHAVTTGVTKSGEPIFPVMPFHYYGQSDPSDIEAIIAYIRTLPPKESKVPESKPDFPFSLIMRTIPHKGKAAKMPSPTDSIAYGGYLVNMAGCVECHTKVDDKMQLVAGTEFGGGREFELPGGTLRTPNITAHATGIGAWTREQFIQRFKQYTDPANVASGLKPTDYNSIMPWTMYGGMTESDLSSIFQYLKSRKAKDNMVVRWEPRKPMASR